MEIIYGTCMILLLDRADSDIFPFVLYKEHFPLEMNKANHCSHLDENMNMLVNNVTLF